MEPFTRRARWRTESKLHKRGGDKRSAIDMNGTERDIEAYIDGCLEPGEHRRVKEYIETDAEAKEKYEHFKRQKEMLQDWWKRKHHN